MQHHYECSYTKPQITNTHNISKWDAYVQPVKENSKWNTPQTTQQETKFLPTKLQVNSLILHCHKHSTLLIPS
jgi:hypothetical protein